jgi:hypothetical protein
MKYCYFFLLQLFCLANANAQNQRFLHVTFPLDTATILELDLFAIDTVETWVGDAVLVETQVRLYDASEGVFNHYINKEKRYDIEAQREGETLRLVSKDKQRPKIKVPDRNAPEKGAMKECVEKVTVKVLIPDVLKPAGDKRWERAKE